MWQAPQNSISYLTYSFSLQLCWAFLLFWTGLNWSRLDLVMCLQSVHRQVVAWESRKDALVYLVVGWLLAGQLGCMGSVKELHVNLPWIRSQVSGQGSHSSKCSSIVGWWRINARHWWDKECTLRCRRRSGMVSHPRSFERWECAVASKAAERHKEGGMGNIRLWICPEEGQEKQHVYI